MAADIRVLLVEDSEDDAALLLRVLRNGGYRVESERVATESEMMAAMESQRWDLILSDYALPGFSGQGALKIWREKEIEIPFIVISGTIGEETAVAMMKAGASDYLMKQNLARLNATIERELREAATRREHKQAERSLRASEQRFSLFMDHFPGLVFIQDVAGQMIYVNRQFSEVFPQVQLVGHSLSDVLSSDWVELLSKGSPQISEGEVIRAVGYVQAGAGKRWYEMTKFLIPREDSMALLGGFALDVTDRMQAEQEVRQAKLNLEDAYEKTLIGWARALEYHERETYGHSKNVVDLSVELAREMGLGEDELVHVKRGALLHDIGKMGIPENVLLKAGPLSPAEWTIVRKHPRMAYELLRQIEFLQPAIDIPYCHHEKWDGTGYPQMLEGENIPLKARIFSVVDVFHALREKRSYGRVWSDTEAIEYIRGQAGTHFDPHVVDVFIAMMARKGIQ